MPQYPYESVEQLGEFLVSQNFARLDKHGLMHLYDGGRDWLLVHLVVAVEHVKARLEGAA